MYMYLQQHKLLHVIIVTTEPIVGTVCVCVYVYPSLQYFTVTGKGVVAGGCGGGGDDDDGDGDDGSHKTSTCSIGWMVVAL